MKYLIALSLLLVVVVATFLAINVSSFISEFRRKDGPTEVYTWKMAKEGPSDFFEPDWLGARWGRALRVHLARRQQPAA